MWCCKHGLAFAAVLLVAACGFRPLYEKPGADRPPTALTSVEVAPIADRIGQIVHNHLLDLINPAGRPRQSRYRLFVTLKESTERLAIQKTELATRANFRLLATYSLVDIRTEAQVGAGNTTVVSSYNILRSEFATRIAENDAQARAAREVAEQIRTRLAVLLAPADDAVAP